jgi:hypothetical protein
MWQQRQSLSVCIWFQDCANLRPLSPCPRRPHPHRSRASYFSISVQFVSRVAPELWCQHDSPSNLAQCEGTGTRPDYLANRADQKNEGPGFPCNRKSRNSRWSSVGDVGAEGIMTKGTNWRESWNQIQTLKERLCCHIYCAHLGIPWHQIVGVYRAVSSRES